MSTWFHWLSIPRRFCHQWYYSSFLGRDTAFENSWQLLKASTSMTRGWQRGHRTVNKIFHLAFHSVNGVPFFSFLPFSLLFKPVFGSLVTYYGIWGLAWYTVLSSVFLSSVFVLSSAGFRLPEVLLFAPRLSRITATVDWHLDEYDSSVWRGILIGRLGALGCISTVQKEEGEFEKH